MLKNKTNKNWEPFLLRTVTLLYAVFFLGCCDRIGRFEMDVFIREKITVTFVEYFIRLWFLVILYLLFTKFTLNTTYF
jgi:hypothetical protein